MAMPPRMPIVADGVVTVMGLILLILPPTRRNTPLLALIARSPVLVAGSYTNLSMVSCALGPTVSEVPSRNTRWARSRVLVVMTSLACTSMPMRNTRSASVGGLPSGSPSVAEVTPTRAAASGMPNRPPNRAIAVVPSSMARTSGKPTRLTVTIFVSLAGVRSASRCRTSHYY